MTQPSGLGGNEAEPAKDYKYDKAAKEDYKSIGILCIRYSQGRHNLRETYGSNDDFYVVQSLTEESAERTGHLDTCFTIYLFWH
uniref:Uncharacterized protein n=1 Tax=Steinernema glaseri TaxID=37863 RepID=A0A1I8AJ92_9BILA